MGSCSLGPGSWKYGKFELTSQIFIVSNDFSSSAALEHSIGGLKRRCCA